MLVALTGPDDLGGQHRFLAPTHHATPRKFRLPLRRRYICRHATEGRQESQTIAIAWNIERLEVIPGLIPRQRCDRTSNLVATPRYVC